MGMVAAVAGVQAIHCTGLFPIKERDGVHLGVVATIDESQVTLRQVFRVCWPPCRSVPLEVVKVAASLAKVVRQFLARNAVVCW